MSNGNAGGLDAVAMPSTAANAVQGAAQEYTAGAPVTANVKGAPFSVGKTNLDPTQTAELLANMQEMIAQRTGGWNQMMNSLKDAAAWAVPGISGQKQLALASRDEAKRAEMQDVFNMRSQMTALKSAQAQAQADASRAQQFISGGAGGTGGAGGAGGAQAGTFASLPPEDQQIILNARSSEQQALIQDALKRQANARLKATFDAAGNKQEIYFVPGVGNVPMTPNQFRELPPDVKRKIEEATVKRFGSLPDAASSAPQLRPQGNAADIAQSLGVPVTSGTRTNQRQSELYAASQQPGYTGPEVAKPGRSQHEFGNAIDVDMKKATPEQLQALRDAGFHQPLPKEPWHWELKGSRETKGEPYKVASTAPVAPPKQIQTPVIPQAPGARALKMPNPGDYNSPDEYKAALKQFEENEAAAREIQTKGGTEYSGNVGKTQAAAAAGVDEGFSTAGDRLNRSTHSLSLVDDPGVRKMVGYLEKPGASAAVLRQIRDGITMGRLGDINLKDFDATLAKSGATQAEINSFNSLVNNLKADELIESRSLLKGQGQVSDSERKLVSSMVGSISNTADALKTAIKWRQERAQLDQEMGDAFNKYREKNGEYAPFGAFMRTDGQRIIQAHNTRLSQILGVSLDKLAGNMAYETPKAGAAKPETENVQSLVDRYKTKK